MTAMGQREKLEREALAGLLLQPSSFDELPGGFKDDAFELPEYRRLFESIRTVCTQREASGVNDFVRLFPDQRRVIDSVLYCAIPLNGKMRSRAAELMRHRPIEETSEPVAVGPRVVANLAVHTPREFEFDLVNGLEIASMEIPPKECSFVTSSMRVR
jgi:hypothetical protein